MKPKKKNKKQEVKALIFDIGNVLIFYDHVIAAIKMSKLTKVSPDKILSVISSDKSKFTLVSDKGVSLKEYWNIAFKEWNVKESPKKFQDI